jgi:hypothetical protein
MNLIVSRMLIVYLYMDCKWYKTGFNKFFSPFRKCQNEANFNQQQQLLLDISSACSLYMLHGIVTISSEDAWYNLLGCFLSYFTNLSKVHSLFVSNFGLSTLTSFCSKLFHNIYVSNFTTYMKNETIIYGWNSSNIFLNKQEQNSRRTERYKHGVKFTITFVENSSHIVAIPNFVLPVGDMEQ